MDVQIDLSGLKIKDLLLFEQAKTGAITQSAMVDLLDRVVVGGAGDLPLTQLGAVVEAIRVAVAALSDPKDGQGKA